MFEWKFWFDPASVALIVVFAIWVASLFGNHRPPPHHPGEMYWQWLAYGLDSITVGFHDDQLRIAETYFERSLVNGLEFIHSGPQNSHEQPHSSCPSSTCTTCASNDQLRTHDPAFWRPLVHGLNSIPSGLQDYPEPHNSCPLPSTGTSCAENNRLHTHGPAETSWRPLVHGLDSLHNGLHDHHEPPNPWPSSPRKWDPEIASPSSSRAAPEGTTTRPPSASQKLVDGDPDVDARAEEFINMMHKMFKCEGAGEFRVRQGRL